MARHYYAQYASQRKKLRFVDRELFLKLRKDVLGADTGFNIIIMALEDYYSLVSTRALERELSLLGPGVMAESWSGRINATTYLYYIFNINNYNTHVIF